MRRAPLRQKLLRLGGPELRVSAFSSPLRSSMLRLGKPLCLGIVKLRLGIPVSSVLVPLFR